MPNPLSLEDVIVATYCALDDALQQAGIVARNGKLISRRGSVPAVDDREILCLAVLQETLGFESDNAFHLWLDNNAIIAALFPRRVSRQNFADRRAILTPLMQKLSGAFCELAGEGDPLFSSSTRTPSKSAAWSGRVIRPGLAVWEKQATAMQSGENSMASVNT